jgi:hypothetical protein
MPGTNVLDTEAYGTSNSPTGAAAAACLGAPFWFDLLNRLGSLRNVGNKPKSDA